jgi:hypothetical protein
MTEKFTLNVSLLSPLPTTPDAAVTITTMTTIQSTTISSSPSPPPHTCTIAQFLFHTGQQQCKILLSSTASRPVLTPTQPAIQWVPGSKAAEAWISPLAVLTLSSAKVKKGGAIPPFPHISSLHSASLIKHRNNFTFFKLYRKMDKMSPISSLSR